MAYAPEGRFILTGERDYSARLWDLDRLYLDAAETLNALPPLTLEQLSEYEAIELEDVLAQEDPEILGGSLEYFYGKMREESSVYVTKTYAANLLEILKVLLENNTNEVDMGKLYAVMGLAQLLIGDYEDAIASAEEMERWEEEDVLISSYCLTTLAHLLDGQVETAKQLYSDWTEDDDNPPLCENALSEFEDIGIDPSDMEKIETLLGGDAAQ